MWVRSANRRKQSTSVLNTARRSSTWHRFIASAVWQFPTGTALPKALGYLARDWEFSSIISAQTGLSLTVAQAQLLNIGGERLIRPFIVAKGALAAGSRTVDN